MPLIQTPLFEPYSVKELRVF